MPPLAHIDDLLPFSALVKKEKSAVEEMLRTIDPDGLSPKAALDALYALKGKLL